MSLKWCEGFEIHQSMTYLARKYAVGSGTLSVQTGRLFGSALSFNSGILTTPSLGVQNTWVVGFGFKINTSVPTTAITLLSGASEQCKLVPTSSGGGYVWVLKRGSTTIDTSATVLDFGVWYYVELKVTARTGTNGVYELRIDEVADISGSMVNLANTGSDGVDVVMFSSASTNVLWDDIYILDDQGGQNDDFLGDSAIRGILPTAEGATNAWVPSSGTDNAALVDDTATSPNDADYNRGVSPGDIDLYEYANVTGLLNGPIAGIMVTSDMRMEATGTATVRVKVREAAVNYDEATHTVNGTSVRGYTQVVENSPDDGLPWEVADIDGMQLGVEKVS
jgi:hypothetical protein